ncbi:hypothetical protein [Chamaesiphon sp. VAR_48_metabat_135_sub]|uniref:hypothetical protein n=1 Tax=Chamaesiphon sp. VAR_48_metabat_135_sub TaxID=2964699 RepID=UPI00286B75E2|nr:hypothetical protein [Chamaesiphon sp. VAR_48_metabat_135_sub]
MQKLLVSTIVISLTTGIPIVALADPYDDFMKTQVSEFESVGSDKCKEQKRTVMERSNKVTYDLCLLQGKPIFLRASNDGTPFSVSNYKKGKLVQLSTWEGTGGVGFLNGKPVVEWNSGEFSQRRVNWKLTAEEKSKYLEIAAKEKRILLKFGIR